MKVEQKEVPTFQPVVITIETREELKELVITMGNASGCYELWERLRDISES